MSAHHIYRSAPRDVVVRERAAVLQLLAREDEALLVGRDALLVLDLLLHVVDRVGRLDVERDGLAREGLDEDLCGRYAVIVCICVCCGGVRQRSTSLLSSGRVTASRRPAGLRGIAQHHRCALTRKGANDSRPGVPGVRRCPPPSASEPLQTRSLYIASIRPRASEKFCTGLLPA